MKQKMLKLHLILFIIIAFAISILSGCGNHTPDSSGSDRYYAGAEDLSWEARQGKVLFDHYCVVCHGAEGAGDGFNAYNLDTRPRDLSEQSFQESLDDRRLEDIIKFGGTFRGGSSLMPAWQSSLNDKELNRVVKYIRTLD